jgi:hypothetical protein
MMLATRQVNLLKYLPFNCQCLHHLCVVYEGQRCLGPLHPELLESVHCRLLVQKLAPGYLVHSLKEYFIPFWSQFEPTTLKI